MKIKMLLAALGATMGLAACDKTPENGDLDGLWQLMQVENYEEQATHDVKTQRLYWAVQLKLLNLRGGGVNALCRFRETGDSLVLYDFYDHLSQSTDTLITDSATTRFEPFGIKGLSGKFAIEQLSHKRMVLKSDYARLTFRKF